MTGSLPRRTHARWSACRRGQKFGPGELVFSVYDGTDCNPLQDIERLCTLFEGMQLLEDDYLGGLGTRGSGKVRFEQIRVQARGGQDYLSEPQTVGTYNNLAELLAGLDDLRGSVRQALVV